MSIELIAVLVAIVAVLATATFEFLVLWEIRSKMGADDAALYLQGKRIEEILRQMRDADAAS
jgi:Tfp pilus assembly protein PilE